MASDRSEHVHEHARHLDNLKQSRVYVVVLGTGSTPVIVLTAVQRVERVVLS